MEHVRNVQNIKLLSVKDLNARNLFVTPVKSFLKWESVDHVHLTRGRERMTNIHVKNPIAQTSSRYYTVVNAGLAPLILDQVLMEIPLINGHAVQSDVDPDSK